ncbi:MAG TPA: MFS transporter [Burkholderiaceae bacterium]|nr:MFS transporter [Burkholderiaceae bacterium]
MATAAAEPQSGARRASTVVALGVGQTLAWASSYYLPAVLSKAMARDLGVSEADVFAALSLALLVAALVGPSAGRAIDRLGGRPVLVLANLVFAAGLALLSAAQGWQGLLAGWIVIGLGMGTGLYEAAFAALVRLHGFDARGPITGVTLIAGFASTVGWPLSAWAGAAFGWRGACIGWAVVHLVVALPLNASIPRAPSRRARANGFAPDASGDSRTIAAEVAHPRLVGIALAYVFAVTWFISTAMAAHLPRLLVAGGASLGVAVALAALVGPAQVVARLLEFTLLRRFDPLFSARAAALAHPLGVLALIAGGAPWAAPFAILHGIGNGILTIAKGTLPLRFFGPGGYGARQGLLGVPSRIAQAAAPLAFGVCLDRFGVASLWLTAALSLSAAATLLALPRPPRPRNE